MENLQSQIQPQQSEQNLDNTQLQENDYREKIINNAKGLLDYQEFLAKEEEYKANLNEQIKRMSSHLSSMHSQIEEIKKAIGMPTEEEAQSQSDPLNKPMEIGPSSNPQSSIENLISQYSAQGAMMAQGQQR